MRRRGAGVGRFKKKIEAQAKLTKISDNIDEELMESMSKQLVIFKEKLEHFAKKHKDDIKRDPVFRQQFQTMCRKVGVDPLASSKGFWSTLLGVGDFYYELAIQAIDVCLNTRSTNGGLISMNELVRCVMEKRGGKSQIISVDDMKQAVKQLSVLGNGFQVLELDGICMVISVPMELNRDHSGVLQLAQLTGYVTYNQVMENKNWTEHRVHTVITHLVEEGMIWVDKGCEPSRYYVPSIFYSEDKNNNNQENDL